MGIQQQLPARQWGDTARDGEDLSNTGIGEEKKGEWKKEEERNKRATKRMEYPGEEK